MKVISNKLFVLVTLLFLATCNIVAADSISVENIKQLTYNSNKDLSPDWSPDDSKILYSIDTGTWPSSQIFEMNVNEGESSRKQLTHGTLAEKGRYSPDGSKIAYDQYFGNLAIMDSEGDLISNEIVVSGGWGYRCSPLPYWSPDGNKIVYSINTDYGSYERHEIYLLDLETRTETKLTEDGDYTEANPIWSPEGTKIAFSRTFDGQTDIWVMDSNGDNKHPITGTPGISESVSSWSPDSSMIAFSSNEYGNWDVFVMCLDGSDKIRLTTDPGNDARPVWSHDGNKIAFDSDRSGNYDIWVIGLNQAPVANAGGPYVGDEGSSIIFDASGSFDPDGDSLTYEWDFGDDNTATGTETTHVYADNGDYTVTLTVTDDDGGVGTDKLTVTVNNVAPVVEAGSDIVVTAGDPVSFSGTFTDAGWLDTHNAEWDFGEGTTEVGSVSEENEYPDSKVTVSGSFSYFDVGEYTVTLSVTDDDGGIGRAQLKVTVLPIVATVDFDPDTLNLGSSGQWVTAYIELPEGYDVAGIDASSVLINDAVSAVTDPKYGFVKDESEYLMDRDGDGIPERMLKFDREEVEAILEAGDEVTVTFEGKVKYDNGISSDMASFEGSDVIKVIEKDSKKD